MLLIYPLKILLLPYVHKLVFFPVFIGHLVHVLMHSVMMSLISLSTCPELVHLC